MENEKIIIIRVNLMYYLVKEKKKIRVDYDFFLLYMNKNKLQKKPPNKIMYIFLLNFN